jgi:hypothetical protein
VNWPRRQRAGPHPKDPHASRRAGHEYERIGERVSIFLNGRVWYANWQEGPKQQRKSLRTRNYDVARQKARALEGQLSGAVPRQAGTFDIAGVRLMCAISVQNLEDFAVRRRRDGMAAKTVSTELTIVRQWLNFAVTRRMLTMSPVAGTKPLKPKPAPCRRQGEGESGPSRRRRGS